MLSNITEPLIGIVDTAVVGQLPQAYFIGAIAVAALIFDIVYWGFGSLRLGTGGLAAQAYGARDMTEVRSVLARALLISTVVGTLIVALNPLISFLSFWFISASDAVEKEAAIYFSIRIWSAPFALANYVILGWFIGMGKTGHALILQLVLNLANVAFDIFFVLGLSMTADGVAWGTLLAEILACLLGGVLIWRHLKTLGGTWSKKRILHRPAMWRTLAVNTDIMIRGLAITFAFAFFTAQSAKAGDNIVASNAILMHMFVASAFFLDGFAFAAEALAGQAVGARDKAGFVQAIRVSGIWIAGVSIIVAIVIFVGGPVFVDLLTINEIIRKMARADLPWAVAAPVAGAASFLLDGVFTGATRTADMRNMMLVSVAFYLVSWYLLVPIYANNGLWAALMVFFITRAITLGFRLPDVVRKI